MRVPALAALAGVMLLPGVAAAQAQMCVPPAQLPRPGADLPSAKEPRRVLPVGGYTLALTWNPGYCRAHRGDPASRFQCEAGTRFGFTLHGLWPDGVGKTWPQYCAKTGIVPEEVVRGAICATPSPQLIQHEWAKHGTCMRETPASYFARSTRLYRQLRFPDMEALSRRVVTVGQFRAEMARVNSGLPADAIRVTVGRGGWLDELWLCLDTRFAYERCKPGTGGAPAAARLRIWRAS